MLALLLVPSGQGGIAPGQSDVALREVLATEHVVRRLLEVRRLAELRQDEHGRARRDLATRRVRAQVARLAV